HTHKHNIPTVRLLPRVNRSTAGLLCSGWRSSASREASGSPTLTYKLEHVPVKDVVVGEALTVEEVPEELPQVRVVWFIVKAQRAAEVQVGGKLGFRGRKTELRTSLPSMPCCCHKRQNQAVGSSSNLELYERMKIIEMHF
uniref:Uncharacterized protein n=1 Tax=Oryzias latipes TaxID=8090 RepID=A0A3B3HAX9_ORYLA